MLMIVNTARLLVYGLSAHPYARIDTLFHTRRKAREQARSASDAK
jgi:hypothetical protein